MNDTKQACFDKVATHLLTQREKSSIGTNCVYRGKDGLKCAIGCLIPDERYLPTMEKKTVETLLYDFPTLREVPEINGNDELLQRLQSCHDAHDVDNWRAQLRLIAEAFNLDPAVVNFETPKL